MKLSTYTEFQKLKAIIVGRAYSKEQFSFIQDGEVKSTLDQILDETEEDIEKLVNLLKELGVAVKRPNITIDLCKNDNGIIKKNIISDGRWTTMMPNAPMWPRDLNLVIGEKVASVYSRNPGRWLEGQSFYHIFKESFESGSQWVSMPPPLLEDSRNSYIDYNESTLLFHAACFLKCGRHVFHTLPENKISNGKGTQLGLDWVKQEFSNFKFVPFNRGGHIDGKIALLKPGLLMSWVDKEELPQELKSWDMIRLRSKQPLPHEFTQLRGKRFYKDFILKWMHEWVGNVDETYFDVNMISIDESTVILNGKNQTLIEELKKRKVEAIPFEFRHRYFWDGGLHCITQDLVREGKMEDYFS